MQCHSFAPGRCLGCTSSTIKLSKHRDKGPVWAQHSNGCHSSALSHQCRTLHVNTKLRFTIIGINFFAKLFTDLNIVTRIFLLLLLLLSFSLLLLFITFKQGIYNHIPETNHVCKVSNVAAILWLQSAVLVMLFPAMNPLCSYISKLSYYNQLSAQSQYLIFYN